VDRTDGSRRWIVAGLAVYGLAALAILLLPISYAQIVDGIDGWIRGTLGITFFGSGWIEFAANIAVFVPLGFLLTLLFRHPWYGTILAVVLSAGVEIAQVVIPHRQPTLRDVISNSIGAAIGAGIAWIVIERRRHRAQTTAAKQTRVAD
jgi:glycopeptide antibiotics resistance protein